MNPYHVPLAPATTQGKDMSWEKQTIVKRLTEGLTIKGIRPSETTRKGGASHRTAKKHARVHWSGDMLDELRAEYATCDSIDALADRLDATSVAVVAMAGKLGLKRQITKETYTHKGAGLVAVEEPDVVPPPDDQQRAELTPHEQRIRKYMERALRRLPLFG